jgi:hypothetical protein
LTERVPWEKVRELAGKEVFARPGKVPRLIADFIRRTREVTGTIHPEDIRAVRGYSMVWDAADSPVDAEEAAPSVEDGGDEDRAGNHASLKVTKGSLFNIKGTSKNSRNALFLSLPRKRESIKIHYMDSPIKSGNDKK